MATLQALAERFGCDDLAAAFPELDIPVLAGPQRQGDLLVLPSTLPARWPHTGPVLLDGGVVIAWSEVSDHTHALYGDGQALLIDGMSPQRARWWRTAKNVGAFLTGSADEDTPNRPKTWQSIKNALAWLNVPSGGEAFLMHSDEHGALGIGPGTYLILRQQEYQDVWGWSPVGD